MAPSTIYLTQALAIGAAAFAVAPLAVQDPYCSQISRYVNAFPTSSAGASSYCSSYFSVTTSTSTATKIVTAQATSTAPTSTATVTTTPTVTVVTGSQTCFQNTAVASPAMKKRTTPQQLAAQQLAAQQSLANVASAAASAASSSAISSACSCYGVNLAPKTTVTSSSTTTSFVATTTPVTTTTTAAPAATTSVEFTTYYVPSGTYVADDGDVFTEYAGFDFYGNDLYTGLCDGSSGGNVNTPVGTFACGGFEGCENVCAEYNDANAAQGAGLQMCKGVTYSESNAFCYLKSAVPGNGSANCMAMQNANTDSGILNAAPGA